MKIFDLEEQIMHCWHIVDDVKFLNQLAKDNILADGDLESVLIGMETLYQLKFQKLFEMFEKVTSEYHNYRKQVEGE